MVESDGARRRCDVMGLTLSLFSGDSSFTQHEALECGLIESSVSGWKKKQEPQIFYSIL